MHVKSRTLKKTNLILIPTRDPKGASEQVLDALTEGNDDYEV